MSKKKQCRKSKPAPARDKPTNSQRPVPRHEQQLAVIDTVLDIEAAFQLLRARPRRTVHIDVNAWARRYGMDGNPHAPIMLVPGLDPEHAATANLRRPLILTTLTLTAAETDAITITRPTRRNTAP